MAPIERSTYFAYNEGLAPGRLRLGTLSFDYANPGTARRTYRPNAADEERFKEAGLVSENKRSSCNLLWSQQTDALLDVDLKKVVEIGRTSTKSDKRLIVGKTGLKSEVIDPDEFFVEHLLQQPAIRQWFETRLSVATSMSAAAKNLWEAPTIWLLIGTYTMKDATVYSIRKESSSKKAAANIPIPEPTGMAELANLKLAGTVRLGEGIEAQASYHTEEELVWAASWIKVKARFVKRPTPKSSAKSLVNQLKLQSVWSVSTTRFPEPPDVDFELQKASEGASENDEDGTFNDAEWEKFDDMLEEHLDDLEIAE